MSNLSPVTQSRVNAILTDMGLSTVHEQPADPVRLIIRDVLYEIRIVEDHLQIAGVWNRVFNDTESMKQVAAKINEYTATQLVPKLVCSQAMGGIQLRYSHWVTGGMSDEQLTALVQLVMKAMDDTAVTLADRFGDLMHVPTEEERQREMEARGHGAQ
ncbi:YbjN domain-containing protein [Corynebacterium choanae]|uniref:Bacterial sensory transduction regulator n=1 Tax=Corynebacterium choanae TaxID=1862358 RepID=A0A3G6J8K2_9CORY|nr:YbjN domain-containing protein [Corynebacterium choanae]AZA14387.1 hypothetical protein CCHOA_10020 [Corynebacterium choanae]